MNVLDEIAAQRVGAGSQCRVRIALSQLPAEVASGYAEAIAMPQEVAQGSAISRALRKRGVELGQHSIQRHRRDGCTCADGLR